MKILLLVILWAFFLSDILSMESPGIFEKDSVNVVNGKKNKKPGIFRKTKAITSKDTARVLAGDAQEFLINKENRKGTKENELSARLSERRLELVRKYGYPNGIRIANRQLWLGITAKMTLESWGVPYYINRNLGNWGNSERWVYSNVYLYFENGVLTSVIKIKAVPENKSK